MLAAATEGHEVTDLTGDSAEASAAALKQAVDDGAIERLVVAGGDGLVHLAIQHLAQTGIPMEIVPSGTGNDFFAGATRVVDAVDSKGLVHVDLLRVSVQDAPTPRWVASIVIGGFPAAINARANTMSLPLGSHIYTAAALLELPRFSRSQVSYKISSDFGDFDLGDVTGISDTAMLAIGNTCYFGGGMLACPEALADDGLLHFTSIEGVGRIGILRHIQKQKGGTADRGEVQRHTGNRCEIDSAGVELWGDGERLGLSPATIEVVPRALTLVGWRGDPAATNSAM